MKECLYLRSNLSKTATLHYWELGDFGETQNSGRGGILCHRNKLALLRSELVTHVPGDWRSWSFANLLEALRKWMGTNPIVETSENRGSSKRPPVPRDRIFHSQDRYVGNCVYCACDSGEHGSSECDKLSTPEERKAFLRSNEPKNWIFFFIHLKLFKR